MQLGYSYFLVYNLVKEDKLRLITARPWILGSYPILLRSWIPDFSAEVEANSKSMAVWINIKFLPIEYHALIILQGIENLIGKTLAIQTKRDGHAYQVCICVSINLSLNLTNQIRINDRIYLLNYKNLHMFFSKPLPLFTVAPKNQTFSIHLKIVQTFKKIQTTALIMTYTENKIHKEIQIFT